jgi:DNA-binding transcriptional MerR regulator/methylmalonyl-CoA mutase cobalamin-binding subunit
MKNATEDISIYPIGYVAQCTELSTHLIRIWEKRYCAIVPKRTDSNRRLFSKAEIKRLQLLKQAVEAGHSISQISNLSSEELMRLIDDNSSNSGLYLVNTRKLTDAPYFLQISFDSITQLNADGLERALDEAAVHLPKLELINSVIVPLLKKVGDLWRQGELKIIYEHMATPIIRSLLWNLLRSTEVSKVAPHIVIATPVNHKHELGALAIALIARESGWRSLYLGPSLPADEIAAAASLSNASAVALSITFSYDHQQLVEEVKKLRRFLSNDTTLFIGGQDASTFSDRFDELNVQLLDSLDNLKLALDNLLKRERN